MVSTVLAPGEALPNVLADPEWHEDFANNLVSKGMSINRPQFGPMLRKWVIHLRYTAHDVTGKPLFLVQASMPLDQQQALWHELARKEKAAVGLLRNDGYLISRLPSDEGRNIYREKNLNGALFLATRRDLHSGIYAGRTADGLVRYGAYQRLSHYPLYAFISYPRNAVVEMWWQGVSIPLYLIAGVFAAGIVLYWVNTRRFTRRMAAVRMALSNVDASGATRLPSSGVQEIDTLGEALAHTQEMLKLAAHNREKLLLAVAEAGTYEVRERDGIVIAADTVFLAMLGRTEAEVVGKPWSILLEDALDLTKGEVAQTEAGTVQHVVTRLKHADDTLRWISISEYREQSNDGTRRHGLAIDVSGRERLLATVRQHSKRLQSLWQLATSRSKDESEKIELLLQLALDALGMEAVLVTERDDDKAIVRHAVDQLGHFYAGQMLEHNDMLCDQVIATKSSLFLADLASSTLDCAHPLLTARGVHVYASIPLWVGKRIYGTLVFLRRVALREGFSADDKVFMEVLASWFEQTLLQQRQRTVLENLALTDGLTELPNRRAAEARFGEELARARRTGEAFAVAICDLDRFKLINDHYGHDVGDEVLQHVSAVMHAQLRAVDWVARWGGEEFIVFLHQSHEEDAFTAMERMRLAIKDNPAMTRHGELDITMSIGIGVLRRSEEGIAQVISEADGCLYDAKKRGRDCVVVSGAARGTALWKAGMLQRALAEERVLPMYQVIVDLANGRTVGDEALARLIQPDGSVTEACEFVEAAEGINLIHVVDQTIIGRSMRRCVDHIKSGKIGIDQLHFINLSPQFLARKELLNGLIEDAQRYCDECGVDFGAYKPVVFEITERQLVVDFEQLASDLRGLQAMGFRLALDDFGSGYSSFLYLAELPVNFLKIEGWMVRNMRHNPRVRGMVQSIIDMARKLDITTIAECIEDRETAEMLRGMGADWGQGFYFGYPQNDESPSALVLPRTGDIIA